MLRIDLLRKTTWVFAFTFIALLVGLITRMFYTASLSVDEYGVLFAAITLFAVFGSYVDVGTYHAAVYFLPKYRRQPDVARSIILFTATITISVAICIATAAFLLRHKIAGIYLNGQYGIIIGLMSLYFLGTALHTISSTIYQGKQAILGYGSLDLARVTSILLLSLLLANIGLAGVALAWALAPFVYLPLYYAYYAFKYRSELRGTWKWRSKLNRELIRYGWNILLSTASMVFIVNVDILLITLLLGSYQTGLYNGALPVASILIFFTVPLTAVLLSATAYFSHRKDIQFIPETLNLLHRYAVVFVLPAALTLIIYPEFVLSMLFGPAYVDAAWTLRILAAAFFFRAMNEVYFAVLAGNGKAAERRRIMFLGITVNLVLSIPLIIFIGIVGAAIGSLITYITIQYASLKELPRMKTPVVHYIKTTGAILLFFGTVELLKYLLPSTLISAIICTIVGGMVYIGYLWIVRAVTKEDLDLLLRALGRAK